MNVMVDVVPAKPHDGTTLASSMSPLLQTVGEPEWSMVRLQGVMGHAFQFHMVAGGGGVMHDNLDWSHAKDIIPELGQFQAFDASNNNPVDDLPSLKKEARDAVLGSLQRGVPVLAWQPMSLEQKQGKDPANHAYCWGLIVGYNDAEETYTIRHPFVPVDYTVRYDELGPADPGGWFGLRIWKQPRTKHSRELHVTELQNALSFARGTMFTDENFVRADGRQAAPYGFAAYETWRDAFESDQVPLGPGHHHAEVLLDRRTAAAAYMRELVGIFPEASQALETAASHYDREVEIVEGLREIILDARKKEAMSDDERVEVRRLLDEALAADRSAVAQIEAVLKILVN